MTEQERYICIGLCEIDPESGCCLGCGRPPLPSPPAAEAPAPAPAPQPEGSPGQVPEGAA